MKKTRSLSDWIYNPRPEEVVCENPFHDIMFRVFSSEPQYNLLLDSSSLNVKIARLIHAGLICLGGDTIYIIERDEYGVHRTHTMGDALDLLAYYLHSDTKEARRAADILETNFMGYCPIKDDLVEKDTIWLEYDSSARQEVIDLKTLSPSKSDPESNHGYYEFGYSNVHDDDLLHFSALSTFFNEVNTAIGEPYFFEKVMMYQFNQPFREKSFVLVGGGGNGKSMFMGLVGKLFGDKALIDSPQPNFRGHDAAVIAYSLIGKRMVTFNDVGDPSVAFLEWLKRMVTGNLEVKTPNGAWLSVPCNANFLMETNHVPQVLDLEAHKRRFIIREFPPDFKLAEHVPGEYLDILGEHGDLTPGDIVNYLMAIKPAVESWTNFAIR